MNTIAINNTNIFQGFFPILSFDYNLSIEEGYKKSSILDELKNDIGNDLFYALSDDDKQFILDTEGSINFVGYKLDSEGIRRIEKSLREDYEY